MKPAYEDLDEELTGNPNGVSGSEIPEPPEVPEVWSAYVTDKQIWRDGWRAGYEAALLDRGRT